jgi:hypothetical protein
MSTSKPASREEFKQFCLRRLGAPLLEINIADEQLEDCIEIAFSYYYDYHYDATEKIYLAHQVTDEDKVNKYIQIPDEIIGITSILDVGDSYSTNNLFNLRYQISLNDLYSFNTGPFAPYYMAFQNVALAEELFVGKQSLRFNRHINKLYIDMSWDTKVKTGEYIIIEGYKKIDADIYTDMYNDRWLQRYCTAQIKKQWGENLKKFEGISMPGGITFNGQKIWDEALDELNQLETEMISSYSLPVLDMVG